MITIFWRKETGWKVEGEKRFRPNVVSLTIMAGSKLQYVVGAYNPPTINRWCIRWINT